MDAIKVKQLNIGGVKQMGTEGHPDPMERPWRSGIFKSRTDETVWLGKTGLMGDAVADTKKHGGPEKALFGYPSQHYSYWKEDLQTEEIGIGAFGENLILTGADESDVCIGDTYKLGEAIVQISQPRQPCWKPARRFRVKDLALRIQNSGRTGWYYRVIEEAPIRSGLTMLLMERPFPEWTIDAANDVMHRQRDDLQLAQQLADVPLLAENWKNTLQKRLRGKSSDITKRVYGPNLDE